tara:strand:- start:1416 stop:1844 length:429 start_codon:yes stop_codon:yes gene_type:complete
MAKKYWIANYPKYETNEIGAEAAAKTFTSVADDSGYVAAGNAHNLQKICKAIASVSGDGIGIDEFTKVGTLLTLATSAAITDVGATTTYTAHDAGGTTVTSNAATDLDTTAAAVAALALDVADLKTAVNKILPVLRNNKLIS